jgi:hypothetical protein
LLVAAGASDAADGGDGGDAGDAVARRRPATVIEGGVAYGMLAMDAYAFGWAGPVN